MHQFTSDEVRQVESAIYQMLCEEHPEMPDEERQRLALEGAAQSLRIAKHEQITGDKAVLLCKCTHPDRPADGHKGHVFGLGKCKDEGCGCPEFKADSVKTEATR